MYITGVFGEVRKFALFPNEQHAHFVALKKHINLISNKNYV